MSIFNVHTLAIVQKIFGKYLAFINEAISRLDWINEEKKLAIFNLLIKKGKCFIGFQSFSEI